MTIPAPTSDRSPRLLYAVGALALLVDLRGIELHHRERLGDVGHAEVRVLGPFLFDFIEEFFVDLGEVVDEV